MISRSAARRAERTRRLDARLRQHAHPQLVLLLGLALTAGRVQQPNQDSPRRLVVWRQAHQVAGMGQSLWRFFFQSAYQLSEQRDAVANRALAFRYAPPVKVVKIRELHAFQEVAAEASRRVLQGLDRCAVEAVGHQLPEPDNIDRDVADVDSDHRAIGYDAPAALVVDQSAQLGQAPAQRAARVVGDFPQQLAQPFAPKLAAFQGQVGQQRARLLGWRQRGGHAISENAEFAEKAQFNRRHDAAYVPIDSCCQLWRNPATARRQYPDSRPNRRKPR